MIIGIDASRAFIKKRTGIEEYSYQVIKSLRSVLKSQQVILYLRPGDKKNIDFSLPKKWQTKELIWGYFWTQFGLSLELLFHPVDVLFVPAHTISFIHPRKSVVVVHGLEYEFSLESYSRSSRLFHKFFIKKSCLWAETVIAVSEKTKKDLIELYQINPGKIMVVPNGFDRLQVRSFTSYQSGNKKEKTPTEDKQTKNNDLYQDNFLFFIGRLEERKNVVGIVNAFNILKKRYGYPGKLLLAGGVGYGYNKIKKTIDKSEFKKDIVELGFVSDKKKWDYFKRANIFLYPSLFEGFGIPILEAQSMGTPVITSDRSPMKETVGDERVLVNPGNLKGIASSINNILQDEKLRADIIKKGLKNIQKYSWEKTAEKIGKILV